jgi:class 3 adenylate cyclase
MQARARRRRAGVRWRQTHVVGARTEYLDIGGDALAGISVHIAQRIQDAAPPREVFVSRTVVDLTAGAGIHSADRGVHRLKGVPGEWPLFAVTR